MRAWADERVGRPARTWLFVPALRAADFLLKADRSGADAIVLDLEDGVAPAERTRAREVIRALRFDKVRAEVFVRVNACADPASADDLVTAVTVRSAGIVLPKVRDAADVRLASRTLAAAEARLGIDELAMVPMIESALGLSNAREIAAADPRNVAIALGGEDLMADVGATRTREGAELGLARGLVVLAAAIAGCAAVDTPWLDLTDHDGAGREAERARHAGFTGMFAIHPAQVGPMNVAFTPTESEVSRAKGIVRALDEAVAAGSGVAVFEGKMVDEPVARAARRMLRRAQ